MIPPAARIPRLIKTGVFILALLATGLLPALAAPEWRQLDKGLDFAFLDAGEITRSGSPRLAVLRIDPRRYRFSVLAGGPGEPGRPAAAWREASGALAVFNAGQYTTDLTYLGLLVRGGKVLAPLVSHMEAIFLAEPSDPALPRARVLDLRYTAFDPDSNPYRQAAQSLMLLDRFGQIRVRRSPKVAHRTVVAEDNEGRILVMVSEGALTLWELANFLTESGLGLREVMCMDGAAEAQIAIEAADFSYHQSGGPSASPDLPWPTVSLPAALAVFSR